MNLKLENISKAFNDKVILQDININLEGGSLFSILGASGAGKSTLLKIIAGIVTPDTGNIYLDGVNITKLKTENRNIPFVFQSPLLFPHMNIEDNIAFGLQVRKENKTIIKEKVDNLLSLLKIQELKGRRPHEISGGQQQRVSIARALATSPPLILMDEPFSSLDPKLREDMGYLLKELQQKLGLTIIFVTHERNESLVLSKELAILQGGKIEQMGSPSEIYYKPINKALGDFMGESNYLPSEAVKALGIDLNPPSGSLLFLRPHKIYINHTGCGFIVNDIKYLGRESRLTLCNNHLSLMVETHNLGKIKVNDEIGLEFPSEDLHYINIFN